MPLEALRYDVTPPGLHYVLTHYDIPAVDPATWRLEVGGAVERPLRWASTSCAPARPSPRGCCSSAPATAGPGSSRARSASRGCWRPWAPPSGPAPRWPRCCEEAGLSPGRRRRRLHRRRPRRGARRRAGLRPRPAARRGAARPTSLLVWAMNGAPLPPQHGAPLRLVVPGWYGMAQVKWLTRIEVLDRAVRRLPERDRLPAQGGRGRARRAGDPDPAAGADGPARAGRTS